MGLRVARSNPKPPGQSCVQDWGCNCRLQGADVWHRSAAGWGLQGELCEWVNALYGVSSAGTKVGTGQECFTGRSSEADGQRLAGGSRPSAAGGPAVSKCSSDLAGGCEGVDNGCQNWAARVSRHGLAFCDASSRIGTMLPQLYAQLRGLGEFGRQTIAGSVGKKASAQGLRRPVHRTPMIGVLWLIYR